MKWQKIETAPREQHILLFNGHWRGVGQLNDLHWDGEWLWYGEGGEPVDPKPTHWMPLPQPPGDEE